MKRQKQSNTTAPKKGREASFGHGMGGVYGFTPKKPGADMAPPTRAKMRKQRAARMARLSGKLI